MMKRLCARLMFRLLRLYFVRRNVILVEPVGRLDATVLAMEGETFILAAPYGPLAFGGLRRVRVHVSRIRKAGRYFEFHP